MASPDMQPVISQRLRRSRPTVAQFAAGAYLLLVAAFAIYIILNVSRGDRAAAALMYGAVVLSSYLGFFHYLPDLLGGTVPSQPIYQRWSNWLRDAHLVGIAALLGMVIAGWSELRTMKDWVPTLAISVALGYAMGLVGTVLRRDLAPCPCSERVPNDRGWRWMLLRVLGVPVRKVYEWLRPPVRLGLGSVLVLSSLLLVLSGEYACKTWRYRGWEVLAGRGKWITAENAAHSYSASVIAPIGLVLYLVALLVAVAVVFALIRASLTKTPVRAPVMLGRAAAIAAVFTASDLALYFMHENWVRSVSVWVIFWGIPLGLYVHFACAREPVSQVWPKVRAALLILYLPIFWLAYAMCLLVAMEKATGFLAYFAGIQLLWWGLSQTGCELAEAPHGMRPSTTASAKSAASV